MIIGLLGKLRFVNMVKIKTDKNIENKLVNLLKNIFDDYDFFIAILSYANTDKLRKLVIEYIEHTKNVSSAEINLLAIDLRDGGEENYNKYWKKK